MTDIYSKLAIIFNIYLGAVINDSVVLIIFLYTILYKIIKSINLYSLLLPVLSVFDNNTRR